MRTKRLLLRLISLSKGEFKANENNLNLIESGTVKVKNPVIGFFNKDNQKLYEQR